MFFFLSKLSFAYSQNDFSFIHTWDKPPKSIILCDDISSEAVQLAVEFWRYYEIIDHVLPIEYSSSCDSYFIDGHILVRGAFSMDIEKTMP